MEFICRHGHSLVCLFLFYFIHRLPGALAANILFLPIIGEGKHYTTLNTIAIETAHLSGQNLAFLCKQKKITAFQG